MLVQWSRTYLGKCSRFWKAEVQLARASTLCLMKKATLALTEDDLQLSLPLKDWPYKLSKADDL